MGRRPQVFDAHVDSLQLALDLGRDLGRAGSGHLDLERGLAGGLGQVVFVCWTDPAYLERGPGVARDRTRDLLAQLHALCERHPDRVGLALSGRDVERLAGESRIAAIAGIEGGHALEDPLVDLEGFFEQGVRMLTLCWNNHLPWIRSCQQGAGVGVPAGLSGQGRDIVRRMNGLGMVVDLSHASERAFHDTLEVTQFPVIASHSGCTALHDHPRNLTDEQLSALRDNGGVVGIVFCTPFLDQAAGVEERRLRATEAYRRIQARNETELNLAQGEFLQRHASPFALDRVAEHIEHAVSVAGIDHVGIGSDFDGIQRRPAGLEDASCYGALAKRLAQRGFSESDVEQVLGANMRRVFAAATGPGTAAAASAEALSPR